MEFSNYILCSLHNFILDRKFNSNLLNPENYLSIRLKSLWRLYFVSNKIKEQNLQESQCKDEIEQKRFQEQTKQHKTKTHACYWFCYLINYKVGSLLPPAFPP